MLCQVLLRCSWMSLLQMYIINFEVVKVLGLKTFWFAFYKNIVDFDSFG